MNIDKREALMQRALEHFKLMETLYNEQTVKSFEASVINTGFPNVNLENFPNYNTEITVEDIDSVNSVIKESKGGKRVCVLNFASYKNPGGYFLQGSSAQEEALCHYSNLYNILVKFRDSYYDINKQSLNNGLYTNKSIYTVDVVFKKDNDECVADVITCAAPNKKVAHIYRGIHESVVYMNMRERINHILRITAIKELDVLILGAFGCGVFGNNPYDVASIFKNLLENDYKGKFKKIVFAIPGGKNYDAFKEVFQEIDW